MSFAVKEAAYRFFCLYYTMTINNNKDLFIVFLWIFYYFLQKIYQFLDFLSMEPFKNGRMFYSYWIAVYFCTELKSFIPDNYIKNPAIRQKPTFKANKIFFAPTLSKPDTKTVG